MSRVRFSRKLAKEWNVAILRSQQAYKAYYASQYNSKYNKEQVEKLYQKSRFATKEAENAENALLLDMQLKSKDLDKYDTIRLYHEDDALRINCYDGAKSEEELVESIEIPFWEIL